MEGILHTFGIDARLIIIQIFNFVLLAAALWYFLYTPVLNLLKDRQEKIEKGVADANAAKQRLSEAEDERLQIVAAAHKEAEEIDARARAHADEKSAEVVKHAEEKATSIVVGAQQEGEDVKKRARAQSEAEIAKLAVLSAEKVLLEKQK